MLGVQYCKLGGWVLQKQMLRWGLGCKISIRNKTCNRKGDEAGLGTGRSQAVAQANPVGSSGLKIALQN